MQIFGQSLTNLADLYLHAGYCSSPPAPNQFAQVYPSLWDTSDTGYAVSLDEAFRLADVADTAATGGINALAVAGPLGVAAAGAAALLGAVWFGLRAGKVPRGRPVRALVAAGILALGSWGAWSACLVADDDDTASDDDASTLTPPWEDVAVRQYADPWLAMNATVHALVSDGAMAYFVDANRQDRDFDLVEIQGFVEMPFAEPDEGQEYAMMTYGLDAWGHEMKLQQDDQDSMLLSAGPDGAWDTVDDRTFPLAVFVRCNPEHWAYYLVRHDDTLWLMTRREPDRDPTDGVEECPGAFPDGDLYDGVPLTVPVLEEMVEEFGEDYQDVDWASRIADINAFYDTFVTPESPEPIVMQVWGTTTGPDEDSGST